MTVATAAAASSDRAANALDKVAAHLDVNIVELRGCLIITRVLGIIISVLPAAAPD